MANRRVENPKGLPEEELPHIWVFANGSFAGGPIAQALSDDGYGLGSHACSSESFFAHDMGILPNSRPDRHESYAKHYSDGYILEHVPKDQIGSHEALQAAFRRAEELYEAKKAEEDKADGD